MLSGVSQSYNDWFTGTNTVFGQHLMIMFVHVACGLLVALIDSTSCLSVLVH